MLPHRTHHAQIRHQQRATLSLFESLLLDYGARVRVRGADIVCLDKAARKRIREAVGGDRGMRIFDRYFTSGAYLVVDNDNTVITTGWRIRRIKRA